MPWYVWGMRGPFVAALVVTLGCTPITPFRSDAGADAGTAGGGFAGGQTSGGTGGGAGGSAGGAAGGSAGGSTGGGLPDFTWTGLSAPANVAVQSISARGTDIYAVSFTGDLLYSTGGAFQRVPDFALPDALDVYVSPSRKVWVVSSRNASLVCTTNCTAGASYQQKLTTTPTEWFLGLCGHEERVFAVAIGTSLSGILLEYTGTAWTRVTTALGVGNVRNCVVTPTGDVYVSGSMGVARVTGSISTPEPIDLGAQPAARWQWVALSFDGGVVTDGLLTGTQGGYRLARRGTNGTWTSLAPAMGSDLFGVVTLSDHEFFAVGAPTAGGPAFMVFDQGALRPVRPPPPLLVSADSLWASGPAELFVVGATSGGMRLVYRGTR